MLYDKYISMRKNNREVKRWKKMISFKNKYKAIKNAFKPTIKVDFHLLIKIVTMCTTSTVLHY